MDAINGHFMTELEIMEVILLMKQKNCEGADRIPQIILVDGILILIKPIAKLFHSVFTIHDN